MAINNHHMNNEDMLKIKSLTLAPYIQLSISLIDKPRIYGGNAFRHCMDTMGILIDYGYCDPALLKAAVVHDLIEDCPEFDQTKISYIDSDGPAVLNLVLEVSRKPEETKPTFLTRIKNEGSFNAKVLKCADRISNMISLGFISSTKFIAKYANETEKYIYPIAKEVNIYMLAELTDLVKSRRFLLDNIKKESK